ncbi:MAG: hypothetical protein ACOVQN_00535 [Exiguobacterium sp.]
MTISKTAWRSFLIKYASCIEPGAEGVVAREVELKIDIQLCVNDILAQLRGTSISYFRQEDGSVGHSTCLEFLDRVFAEVFKVLEDTSVTTYVICIDPYGMRPIEKTATAIKRSKRARPEDAPEQLEMPYGQPFYFVDQAPMPGSINLIFETPRAKMEFYEYITAYFKAEKTRERIPEGKCIILSGGLEITDWAQRTYRNLPPVVFSHSSYIIREDWAAPHIREGDIDVLRWVYHFSSMNFHVCSYDADVVLICMLQMRRILKKNKDRKGWVVTRRSVSSQYPDDRYAANLEKRRCLRKEIYDTVLEQTQDPTQAHVAAGGSFAESAPSTMRRPSWVIYYINMVTIYKAIVNDALSSGYDARVAPNLMEIYVLAFILSSEDHDYIQTKAISHNVGSQFVWSTFEKQASSFLDLVSVYKHSVVNDNRMLYYVVDKEVLFDLVRAFYREKAEASIKEEGKTAAQLISARDKSYLTNFTKNGPSDSQVWLVASQCAWLLQYWGNGPIPGYEWVDGTIVSGEGESVYGFTSLGWAEKVLEKGKKRICPPVPRQQE